MTKNRAAVACAACLLAAASACTPTASGEGSESHFACRRQADCEPLGVTFVCEEGLCTDDPIESTPEGGSPGDASGSAATSLEPGVCFGENTHCGPIEYAVFEPGPTVEACDNAPDDPATITLTPEWFAELDRVPCPAPGCFQRVGELVGGLDGELWVNAEVWTPGPEAPAGTERVGASLVHLDAVGQPLGAPVTTYRSRLSDADVTIAGIALDAEGGLFRAAPSATFRGVDLERYERSGDRIIARTIADGVLDARVGWGEDGSAVVLYRYLPEDASRDASTVVRSRIDVARFDAAGHLSWNQTGLERISDEQPGTRLAATLSSSAYVAVDDGGNTTIVIEVTYESEQTPDAGGGKRIVSLDPNGNVRWARALSHDDSSSVRRAALLPAAGVLLLHEDEAFRGVIDELDSDGNAVRRHLQATNHAGAPPLLDGRRLIQQNGYTDTTTSFQIFNLDTNTCTQVSVPHAPVVATGPESYWSPDVVTGVADGIFYFAVVGTRIGAVRLP